MSIKRFLLHSCNSGVALIEFAFALPLLLIMLIGMMELSYYALVIQKLDKVANSMADFVTQGSTVGITDLNTFGQAVPQIMQPFAFNGTVIFSNVSNFSVPTAPCLTTGVSCVKWQYKVLGTDASQVGSVGGLATLPSGYTVLSNQSVIMAEAYLNYSPLLSTSGNFIPAFTAQKLYKVALYKPRQGTLTVLGP